MLDDVFTYQQQRGLSCEYASVQIATTLLGQLVSEYEIEQVVPLAENPHRGYRGDITGTWGNTDDYGIYNEPLAEALRVFGYQGKVSYGDLNELESELDQGRPVIVWLGMWGDAGSFDIYSETGSRYQLTTGMHVIVAYGYDDERVYLTDPGTAILREYEKAEFVRLWNVMDGMALSVWR
ncbi:MAG: C39 family peptidase [Thermomicrobiales bacterium]